MKRWFTVMLTLLMLATMVVPAAADAIYEPRDSFYTAHIGECYRSERRYMVNSVDGHVYVYQNPESFLTVDALPNGETMVISHIYRPSNGEEWGLLISESGWVKMSQMSLVYDSKAFIEEHKDRCQPYVPGTYTAEVSAENPMDKWDYPGGEITSAGAITQTDLFDNIQMTYTDSRGAVWGYVPYFMGMKEFWVRLADHEADSDTEGTRPNSPDVDTPDETIPAIVLKADPTPKDDIPMSRGNKIMFVVVGALTTAVVVGTAVLIRVMFVKKKKA